MQSRTITPEFIDAVRESVRRQAQAAIERRSLVDLEQCPRCLDRIIHLTEPLTFARDESGPICRSCRAQAELTADLYIELGGEG